jgi:hypothetical protein
MRAPVEAEQPLAFVSRETSASWLGSPLRSCAAMAALLMATTLAAQPRGITWRTVWFEDGTALDFDTQSTGSTTPVSTNGSNTFSVFSGMHRVVLDKDGKLLFIYGVEAWRDALPQTFFVRIKPVDRGFEQERALGMPWLFEKATHPFPTVAAVRDFPGVKLGDAIVLDILRNPATGEKIFDVITPIENSAARAVATDEFNFSGPRIVVNGQSMTVAGSGAAAGAGLAIRLPAKGSYYLATEPSAKYSFQPAGKVERDRMTIALGDDRIEIVAAGNILKNSAYRTIWVYRDAGQDPKYAALERRIRLLRASLETLHGYTEKHPYVVSTKTAIEVLEQKQDQLTRTVTLEAAGTVYALMSKPQEGGRK